MFSNVPGDSQKIVKLKEFINVVLLLDAVLNDVT